MANDRLRYENAITLHGQAEMHEALAEVFTKLHEFQVEIDEQGDLTEERGEEYSMYVKLLDDWETVGMRYVTDRLQRAVREEREKRDAKKRSKPRLEC